MSGVTSESAVDSSSVDAMLDNQQREFGVKCSHCQRYITGKALQAGDNYHFHPSCARCTKCGDNFGDGEVMFMQSSAIWHPRCGPGPDEKIEDNQAELEQQQQEQEQQLYLANSRNTLNNQQRQARRCFSSMSSMRSRSVSPFGTSYSQYGRSRSPGFFDKEQSMCGNDLSRFYTFSYLASEPNQGYLKRPLDPRPPKSPQFHRPAGVNVRRRSFTKQLPKQGMQSLVDNLQSSTPRPRSPHMNNEEPINMAHYPDGRRPGPREVARIERDDFPAPPFPYSDPDRRRRWSESSKELSDAPDGGGLDSPEEQVEEDPRLRKEADELSKISTGIGKVFLQSVKEREKIRAWKQLHVDPRNASRNPSAKSEVHQRLRYDNPVNASPSRDLDRPKPWEEDELDRGSVFRSSAGKSAYVAPPVNYNVVPSSRNFPRLGYGLKSTSGRTSNGADSPLSISSQSERPDSGVGGGRSSQNINHSVSGYGGNFRMTPYSEGGFGALRHASYSPHMRRSMPNVNAMHALHPSEPPKCYPYHLLVTTNYRLPPDVDRFHLERHLSNEEFMGIFHVARLDFYRLPEWKRSDLKKRARLF